MRSYKDLRKGLFLSSIIISAFQSGISAAANVVILDNGKPGTSSTEPWKISSGVNSYGSKSVFSGHSGDSYTYKFNLAAPGEYQVFARWTEWSNRRTSVPYDIRHLGGTSTVKVNQRQNGGQWRQLGGILSFGSTATIKLRSLGNGTTSADAIKLVPVGGNIAPVVKTIGSQTVNVGDTLRFNVSATDSDGTSPVLSAKNLPANALFIDNNNGTGVFSWPTVSGDTGSYNITFIATDTSNPTVTGNKTVSISVVDGASPVILDNGKPGTSSTEPWKISSGVNSYGSKSVFSGHSGDSYTYKFNLAAPGEYQVFARWTEWSNRRTSVPYDIRHLGGTSTVKVNQRQNGGQWRQLGGILSFGSTATIKLRSLGNGTTSADAIKLVPVSGNSNAIDEVLNTPPPPNNSNTLGLVFNQDFTDINAGTVLTTSQIKNAFATGTSGVINQASPGATVVSDPANSGRGNVLRMFFPEGEVGNANLGGAWQTRIPANDEYYFAYDIYVPVDFNFPISTKLPGIFGGNMSKAAGNKADMNGVDGFSVFQAMFSELKEGDDKGYKYIGDGNLGASTFTYANPQRIRRYNRALNNSWLDGSPARAIPGKWVRLEQRVKLNDATAKTGVGVKNNGIYEVWLDGEQVFYADNWVYRQTTSLQVDGIFFIWWYGGSGSSYASREDQYLYFDNFVVSKLPISH